MPMIWKTPAGCAIGGRFIDDRKDYPRMAAAARNYLAIPASEVSVERLFSVGRDILGTQRYSMKGDTMRFFMLLGDVYKH
jgi:hAT family C-terminal dimerisation region